MKQELPTGVVVAIIVAIVLLRASSCIALGQAARRARVALARCRLRRLCLVGARRPTSKAAATNPSPSQSS